MNFEQPHATAIRMEVLAVLRENESLETLSILSDHAKYDDYLVFVATIQPKTTLKSLRLYDFDLCVENDETKNLIPVFKKNYGLETLSGFQHGAGDILSILQLNRAGRRYLAQDGSSISKGVDVLSTVSDDINSVFLHLLENPRLCDCSAVEMLSIGHIGNTRLMSKRKQSGGSGTGGKQGPQTPTYMAKESRRRLE